MYSPKDLHSFQSWQPVLVTLQDGDELLYRLNIDIFRWILSIPMSNTGIEPQIPHTTQRVFSAHSQEYAVELKSRIPPRTLGMLMLSECRPWRISHNHRVLEKNGPPRFADLLRHEEQRSPGNFDAIVVFSRAPLSQGATFCEDWSWVAGKREARVDFQPQLVRQLEEAYGLSGRLDLVVASFWQGDGARGLQILLVLTSIFYVHVAEAHGSSILPQTSTSSSHLDVSGRLGTRYCCLGKCCVVSGFFAGDGCWTEVNPRDALWLILG